MSSAGAESPYPRRIQFLDSSVVELAGYDEESRSLVVGFRTTKSLWIYAGVSPTTFAELCSAPSPGRYYNGRIRDRYVATRLYPAPGTVAVSTKEAGHGH